MMQNLVGVRVADAAEEMRIGERTLERVVFASLTSPERSGRRAEHLESARIERRESRVIDEVNARALLRACFRENERAGVGLIGLWSGSEVERSKTELPGYG